MVTLYGIPNCDTVRKAKSWLETRGIPFRFHDLRRDGVEPDRMNSWIDALGWETLLNRRSATWRRLPAERKESLDRAAATTLMREFPTLIRRPVLEAEGNVLAGFEAKRWREVLE